MNKEIQKLEALLFTAGAPVAKRNLIKQIGCDNEALEHLLEMLQKERKESGVTMVDDGTQVVLTTNPSLADFIEQMEEKNKTAPLSRASQETLSIIAYAGPITKTDLDFLRGVNTHYTLRQLTMRGLIQDEQREHTKMVSVTTEFLQHLGVQKKEEMQEYEKNSPHHIGRIATGAGANKRERGMSGEK